MALLLTQTAPGSAARDVGTYTVGEVWARHQELDGQTIRVQGVVLKCQTLGCSLLENTGPHPKHIGLGGDGQLDYDLQSVLRRRVVVEGRFDARCLHIWADPPLETPGHELSVCLDRATMLHDPKIVSVR